MVCAPAVVRQSTFMCFGGVTLVRALIGEIGLFSRAGRYTGSYRIPVFIFLTI